MTGKRTNGPHAYTGQRFDGQAGLAMLDGDHTGSPQPGALILVRRDADCTDPMRMLLVERVKCGDTYDARLRDWPRSIWAVRPERPIR